MDIDFELLPEESYSTVCPRCTPNRSKSSSRSLYVLRKGDGYIRYQCRHEGQCEWNDWQRTVDPDYSDTISDNSKQGYSRIPAQTIIPMEYNGNHIYWYRHEDGTYSYGVMRINLEQGKVYVPFAYTDEGFKYGKEVSYPKQKLWYNMHEFHKSDVLLIVEGEKAADAAAKLFPSICVTTWRGGAPGVKGQDYSMLSKFKKVILWPDNDIPGKNCMEYIASQLTNASVKMVDTSVFEKGADLADNLDPFEVKAQLTSAKELKSEKAKRFKPITMSSIRSQAVDTPSYGSTGYPEIDAFVKYPGSGIVAIEGRAKSRKTRFAVNSCYNLLQQGKKIVFISYEMTASEVMGLFYRLHSGTNHPVKDYIGTDTELYFANLMESGQFSLFDQEYQLKSDEVLELFSDEDYHDCVAVMDYLQIIPITTTRANQDQRYLQIKNFIDALRVQAKNNKQLILMLTQLTPSGIAPSLDSPREGRDIDYSVELTFQIWNNAKGKHDRMRVATQDMCLFVRQSRYFADNIGFEFKADPSGKLHFHSRIEVNESSATNTRGK